MNQMNHTQNRKMNPLHSALSLALLSTLGTLGCNSQAHAAAVAVRAGSFGYGADVDVGLTETLNLRLGYNTFSLNRTINDTDVTYKGKIKISAASGILDWHVFHGGFRLSVGAVQNGPKVDATGVPNSNQTYVINGNTYTADQIGSATGSIKMGDSVSPYLGIGWGNTVDEAERVTFLLDLGVIKTGAPKVTLNFTCNPSLANNCSQFASDVAKEKADLEDELSKYEWYPVVALGVAIRF